MSWRVLVAATALGVAGCGNAASAPSAQPSTVTGTVTVFAAASLTEAFERMASDFEAAHPGVRISFNFGASSALGQSILAGAPADVFAAANPASMRVVTDAGDAGPPAAFARNTLEIAVPAGNPAGVTGLADLARRELTIALCAPQVPCGAATEQLLAATGLRAAPDTLEQDVKAVLSKVSLGEVDAGLVYRTDVRAAAGRVQGVEVPSAGTAANDYQVAVLTAAPNAAAAQAFVSHVRSPEGQRALGDQGFQTV